MSYQRELELTYTTQPIMVKESKRKTKYILNYQHLLAGQKRVKWIWKNYQQLVVKERKTNMKNVLNYQPITWWSEQEKKGQATTSGMS